MKLRLSRLATAPGPRRALAACAAAGSVVTLAAVAPAPAGSAPSTPTWRTVFQDDFNGSGPLDGRRWKFITGTRVPGGPPQFGTWEIERYTNSTRNVRRQQGSLVIQAHRSSSGWSSARVETWQTFMPRDGGAMSVEGRMTLPSPARGKNVKGYWPAFWLLGAPYRQNPMSWPGVGEIDVMENVHGLNRVWGTLHCDVWTNSTRGACHESDGRGGSTTPRNGRSLQAGPHTYKIVWDRRGTEKVSWYLDGRLYWQVLARDVNRDPAASSSSAWQKSFRHPFYLVLNLAIGGSMPTNIKAADGTSGSPNANTTSGAALKVDWVRVQLLDPPRTTNPRPAPRPTTGCTGRNANVTFQHARIKGGAWSSSRGAVMGLHNRSSFTIGSRTCGWSPSTISIRHASGAPSGVSGLLTVQTASGKVVARFELGPTGGWNRWVTLRQSVRTPIGGNQTLRFVFSSGQPNTFTHLRSFSLS